ncbi:MAG: Gfo/Idh/MocA family oxidoreductase [Treponema sp.]|jgi:predicted dehydrogenase|nr:Gfo/Idh/MocA family oxidoreductase [Treponema sp.]
MEKYKAAIVGLGRIASLLEEDTLREKPCTHAGAIAANEDCVLTAGSDTDEERRRLFAEKWQVPVFENATEMLLAHKPQILVIATHPDSHYRYCRLAENHNIPVVICEKPLADNIDSARKIARIAEKENTPTIITNHERRYSQDYIRAKEILDDEKLGRVLAVRSCLYMGKNRRLIDQFWHDGTHLADAIMFLTNSSLKHRRSWGAKLNSRSGTAWLEGELRKEKSKPPVPVIFEIGSERDHLVFEIEFSCEKGRLRIGNGVFEVFESVPSPYAEKFRSLKNTGETFTGPTGYFSNMLKDAVSCVRDSKLKPRSGAIDGLRVIEYLNRVRRWK